jgi:hypothetical protein
MVTERMTLDRLRINGVGVTTVAGAAAETGVGVAGAEVVTAVGVNAIGATEPSAVESGRPRLIIIGLLRVTSITSVVELDKSVDLGDLPSIDAAAAVAFEIALEPDNDELGVDTATATSLGLMAGISVTIEGEGGNVAYQRSDIATTTALSDKAAKLSI